MNVSFHKIQSSLDVFFFVVLFFCFFFFLDNMGDLLQQGQYTASDMMKSNNA